jgi:hypothetical protein
MNTSFGLPLAIWDGLPAWSWNLIVPAILIALCMVTVVPVMMLMWFSRLKTQSGSYIGGGWFHPRAELVDGETVDETMRAAFVSNQHRNEMGVLAVTARRAIFLPAHFPWENKTTTSIDFREITRVQQERLPAPEELGPLGGMFRVQGLRLDTEKGTFWFGKPNLKKIEAAFRTRAGA